MTKTDQERICKLYLESDEYRDGKDPNYGEVSDYDSRTTIPYDHTDEDVSFGPEEVVSAKNNIKHVKFLVRYLVKGGLPFQNATDHLYNLLNNDDDSYQCGAVIQAMMKKGSTEISLKDVEDQM
jgi:hypothetical protein